MKFTDSEGREYESLYKLDGGFVIQRLPVKQEPKWQISQPTIVYNDETTGFAMKLSVLGIGKDQAQLIREAVEALMEYVSGPYMILDESQSEFKFVNKAEKARQSMRENN